MRGRSDCHKTAKREHGTPHDARSAQIHHCAQIVVEQDGQSREIDARPSDAIALSVRLDVPIYVAETVMDRASITADEDIENTEEEEKPSEPTKPAKGAGKKLSLFEDFVESLDLDDL